MVKITLACFLILTSAAQLHALRLCGHLFFPPCATTATTSISTTAITMDGSDYDENDECDDGECEATNNARAAAIAQKLTPLDECENKFPGVNNMKAKLDKSKCKIVCSSGTRFNETINRSDGISCSKKRVCLNGKCKKAATTTTSTTITTRKPTTTRRPVTRFSSLMTSPASSMGPRRKRHYNRWNRN